MKLTFPDGFYWGAATASYQVEGGIENNDWAEAARQGNVPVAGESSDHYRRYEKDFDIAKSLGHNAHRISIEWARIEPHEGEFNTREIEHYRDVLRALRKRNIEPFVTLWHFTLPLWLSEKGGAEHPDFPEYFARYSSYVVKELNGGCRHFSTINEPTGFSSNGWLRGQWPPFKRWRFFQFLSVSKNLTRAHNLAYQRIKHVSPSSIVSIVKDNIYFHSNRNPLNIVFATYMNWFWNRRFLNKVHRHCDWIGLNYYFHKKFGETKKYPKSDFGWDIYPPGIYGTLLELKRYGKPVIISESGIADARDAYRAEFIKNHLKWCHRAIEEGVDLRGYLYWSLLDNFEWAMGYDMRFGLVAIDYDTKERTVRPSAQVYKKICETNVVQL